MLQPLNMELQEINFGVHHGLEVIYLLNGGKTKGTYFNWVKNGLNFFFFFILKRRKRGKLETKPNSHYFSFFRPMLSVYLKLCEKNRYLPNFILNEKKIFMIKTAFPLWEEKNVLLYKRTQNQYRIPVYSFLLCEMG